MTRESLGGEQQDIVFRRAPESSWLVAAHGLTEPRINTDSAAYCQPDLSGLLPLVFTYKRILFIVYQ
jgi:hypothetical protein